MEAEPSTARTIRPGKRVHRRPPTSPPLHRVASSTIHTQQLEVAPVCSLLGGDDGDLMSMFSSQVTGVPAHGGDPLSSHFPWQSASVLGADSSSVLSSHFPWQSVPVLGGDRMSMLSSEFIGAAGPTHDDDLECIFSSQLFTGEAAPAIDSDVKSVFSSMFPEVMAPAHDGNPNTLSLSQYTTAPADDESMFTSQFTGARAPVHGGDPMSMFSRLVHDGDPMSVFSSLVHDGDPMSMFSGQLTGAAPPMHDGYPMPMFPSHLMGAATPMHGGYPLPVFPSQLIRGAAPMHGGYPMSMLPSQFMGVAGPVQLKGVVSPAPAPAYSDDPMFVLRSKSKPTPALKPWTGEDLLFDQVPRAYPNNSNLGEEIWKIVDGKAQSRGYWNDGIVDNSRDQNDKGDDSFKVVLQNISLPPPTNLLQGRGPPLPPPKLLQPQPQQMAAKKGKRRANVAWTVEEQRLFLKGLINCPKGDWKSISREYVKSKTPTQVASHAQKYQMRQKDRQEGRLIGKRKSIHDITLD